MGCRHASSHARFEALLVLRRGAARAQLVHAVKERSFSDRARVRHRRLRRRQRQLDTRTPAKLVPDGDPGCRRNEYCRHRARERRHRRTDADSRSNRLCANRCATDHECRGKRVSSSDEQPDDSGCGGCENSAAQPDARFRGVGGARTARRQFHRDFLYHRISKHERDTRRRGVADDQLSGGSPDDRDELLSRVLRLDRHEPGVEYRCRTSDGCR